MGTKASIDAAETKRKDLVQEWLKVRDAIERLTRGDDVDSAPDDFREMLKAIDESFSERPRLNDEVLNRRAGY